MAWRRRHSSLQVVFLDDYVEVTRIVPATGYVLCKVVSTSRIAESDCVAAIFG